MVQHKITDSNTSARKVGARCGLAVAVSLLIWLASRDRDILPIAFAAGTRGSYTTSFPLTETPISESGNWINGKANGLDWANVVTTPGLAMGTESGAGGFDDSTALLTGSWGPNQTATATVRSVNQNSNILRRGREILPRSSISAHINSGYEINFRCLASGTTYIQIVRWNGALGSFTLLDARAGSRN